MTVFLIASNKYYLDIIFYKKGLQAIYQIKFLILIDILIGVVQLIINLLLMKMKKYIIVYEDQALIKENLILKLIKINVFVI